jgi:hypothetical protein
MHRDIKTHEWLVGSSSGAREQRRDLAHRVRRTRDWDCGWYYRWESPSESRKSRCIHLHCSHFAAVAEVEVGAIKALVTNTDDRSLIATIAGGATVDDWAGLARSTVSTEGLHWNDGASRRDWLGDELERVIKRSTVNCVRGIIPRAFATLDNRRADVSNLESEAE